MVPREWGGLDVGYGKARAINVERTVKHSKLWREAR